MYRYILRESCSQFDSLPLTSLSTALIDALHGERPVVVALGTKREAALIAARNAKVAEDLGRMLHEIDGEMHMTVWAGDAAQPTLHVASASREETVPLKAKLRSEMAQVGGAGGRKGRLASLAKSNAKAVSTPKKPRSVLHFFCLLFFFISFVLLSFVDSPSLLFARAGRTRATTLRGRSTIPPPGRRGRRRSKRAACSPSRPGRGATRPARCALSCERSFRSGRKSQRWTRRWRCGER